MRYAQRSVEWRRREIEQEAVRMATAERIVIVGGGTVGVELAAEIVGKWKDQTKHVTLITKHTKCDHPSPFLHFP